MATGGVEWDIAVPSRAISLFGSRGEPTEAYVWLHHYEDGMRLFGFPSPGERALFLDLMKVEGIGPRQALKILSGMGPEDLAAALEAGNLAALQKISGVGPKMAQKMVLALKGKLVELSPSRPSSGDSGAAGPWFDLVRSLSDMGFDRRAVEAAVRKHAPGLISGAEAEKELFRRALVELSTGGSGQ
ncbi:MAG: holliday junction DNA helicase RuvA [Spirochaetes bacterium]|nr:MAG: holliday junction DNA helicase RuvA [Spirochaetota bacterium]